MEVCGLRSAKDGGGAGGRCRGRRKEEGAPEQSFTARIEISCGEKRQKSNLGRGDLRTIFNFSPFSSSALASSQAGVSADYLFTAFRLSKSRTALASPHPAQQSLRSHGATRSWIHVSDACS